MAGFFDSFNDPSTQGLLAMSAGLLQAGGPSRLPVSLGSALGQGAFSGINAAQAARAQQAQQQMTGLHAALYGAQAAKFQQEALRQQRVNEILGGGAAPQGPAAPGAMPAGPALAGGFTPDSQPMPYNYQGGSFVPPAAPTAPFGGAGAQTPALADPAAGYRATAQRLLQAGAFEEAGKLLEAANKLDTETFSPHNVQGPGGVPIIAMAGNKGSIRPTTYNPASTIPEGMRIGANGDLVAPQGLLNYKTQVAAASKPSVQVKVDTGLTDNIKDIVAGSYNSAKGAVQTMDAANRIASAVNSGQVNIGPGATVKQTLDQVSNVLGVGGKDADERLANTRQVMRGLAQFTLGARKQLAGQGPITDFETRVLNKAESGEIDQLTAPELKALVDVTARASKAAYNEHQRIVGVMGKHERHKEIVPYYQVPALPEYTGFSASPGASPKVRTYNPNTGNIE